jgi:protoporphyrinogen oxidase
MNIGIIGGGMMGLATAFYLSQKGHQITIIEKENEIGGLCRSEEILPNVFWDRFYHVILSTDKELLNFINDIGLSADIRFRETKTGFYTNGQLHSMSNTLEFLKFPPLSLLDKIRLGIGILYVSKINNWKPLEKISIKTWLTRVFGRRNYEKMWDPLLRSKLGSAKDQASAALIWAIIKRYYGTRHSSSKKEQLGCVKGGYSSILKHVEDYLRKNDSEIVLNQNVSKLGLVNGDRVRIFTQNGQMLEFDRVVVTAPNPEVRRIMPEMPPDFDCRLNEVRYLNIICALMILKKSLTPFYITNLTDSNLPFTGLIEATNVMPPDILKDHTLIYLPKWLPSGDPFFDKSNQEILNIFTRALMNMFPDLSEEDIVNLTVHRAKFVQPILDINYSEKILPMKTPLKNIYLVNTTMIRNSTLNNNEVVRLAKKAAETVIYE